MPFLRLRVAGLQARLRLTTLKCSPHPRLQVQTFFYPIQLLRPFYCSKEILAARKSQTMEEHSPGVVHCECEMVKFDSRIIAKIFIFQ